MVEVKPRYEIVRPIARGGMAEVLLARRFDPDGTVRSVALKRVLPDLATDPRLVRMFLDEARLAIRIVHPNVVRVLEAGEGPSGPFLAMELVDGPSLDLLRAGAPDRKLPLAITCGIVAQAARGLHHAHALTGEDGRPIGIVHRDVSPQNVLIGRDGVVRIADFGVAKAKTHAMRTMTGVLKGKVSYMSPEQLRDEPIDGRADVFSLGVILFECLTGHRLYKRTQPLDAIDEIVGAPVPRVRDLAPEVPSELDRIVRRCLAKSPGDRPESAGALGRDLDQFLAARDLDGSLAAIARAVAETLARPVATAVETREATSIRLPMRRGPGIVVVGALLAVAAALLALLLWR